MKFFVDSAVTEDIEMAKKMGLADGVTTNPTLIKKSGRDFEQTIKDIATIITGPIAVEPVSTDCKGILEEGHRFAGWADNVSVKIPVTREGLRAVNILTEEGISTTVTLIFSSSQALLAAKAGADYICPFIGRLDDISTPGLDLIAEIVTIFNNYEAITTELIAASIRSPLHVLDVARMGGHGVTIPPAVAEKMALHPLTDAGIEKFLQDWNKIS